MKAFSVLLALCAATVSAAEPKPLQKLDRAELSSRLERDARDVLVHRDGLIGVNRYLDSRPDLFPAAAASGQRLLPREEKEALWNTWQRFLDYVLALESIEKYHRDFYRLKGTEREDSFLIGYAAMLAKYRAGLEFVSRTERNPELDKVLNDPVPEIGLPAGTFARLRFKYLNAATAGEFAAREALLKILSGERQPSLRKGLQADAAYLWDAGKGRGEELTARNAWRIVRSGAGSAWLPVQAGVSEWMGDTKVYRPDEALISPAQIREVQAILRPGDILLERREWYLSNVGLPGFWSHAALYIGTPEERAAALADPETAAWVKQQGEAGGDLEQLLQRRSPAAYEQSRKLQDHGHAVRVIEAISEGVSLTTLEHSAACDSLAVLRPRRTAVEKARAIVQAFHYAGRPYDFNFDFSTDAELVCTELVCKSYEPASGFSGLRFPLVTMLGRQVTPANDIAKQFAAQYGTGEQQTDLVLFLDGRERGRKAVTASAGEFCDSCKRPKWHVFVQEQSGVGSTSFP